jgi:hypothetical protein
MRSSKALKATSEKTFGLLHTAGDASYRWKERELMFDLSPLCIGMAAQVIGSGIRQNIGRWTVG